MPFITTATITAIEAQIGYKFEDPDRLKEAFYAAGPTTINGRPLNEANKRLAQLGDSVLKLIVDSNCFDNGLNRGATSTELQTKASNKALDRVGRKFGWDHRLINQDGCVWVSDGMTATAVQAVLGAVWVDSRHDLVSVRKVADAMCL